MVLCYIPCIPVSLVLHHSIIIIFEVALPEAARCPLTKRGGLYQLCGEVPAGGGSWSISRWPWGCSCPKSPAAARYEVPQEQVGLCPPAERTGPQKKENGVRGVQVGCWCCGRRLCGNLWCVGENTSGTVSSSPRSRKGKDPNKLGGYLRRLFKNSCMETCPLTLTSCLVTAHVE